MDQAAIDSLRQELEAQTVASLRKLASAEGIKGASRIRKANLIVAIIDGRVERHEQEMAGRTPQIEETETETAGQVLDRWEREKGIQPEVVDIGHGIGAVFVEPEKPKAKKPAPKAKRQTQQEIIDSADEWTPEGEPKTPAALIQIGLLSRIDPGSIAKAVQERFPKYRGAGGPLPSVKVYRRRMTTSGLLTDVGQTPAGEEKLAKLLGKS